MVRQYIGARYTIKVYTNSITPSSADWESGVSYEPIMLVTFGGDSYLSKKPVPSNIGDPASNPDYWVIVGNTTAQITQLENDVAYLMARTYDTYADAVADAGLYGEGDIIATLGYNTAGSAPGLYIIHTTSAPQYIAFGSKYAELAFYDDVILFDALGGRNNPDVAMAAALALIMANNPPSNISQDIHRGGATIKFGRMLYSFSNKITIPAGLMAITFEGINHDTEFGYDGDPEPLFDFVYNSSAWGDNIHFKNIVFEGAGRMVNMEYVRFSSFVNCVFANAAGSYSIKLENCVGIDLFENYFMLAERGLIIRNNTTTVNIRSCEFVTCDKGIETNNINGLIIKDSIIEYNDTYGFVFKNSSNVVIHNVWFEGNPCVAENVDLEAIGNSFHIGTNSVVAKIDMVNSTANKYNIYAPNIDISSGAGSGIILDDFSKYTGSFSYINGDSYDLTNRRVTLKDKNTFNPITGFGSVGVRHGFMEIHGETGTYFASYVLDAGTSYTISTIGGTLTPDAYNQYGATEFNVAIPDPTGTIIVYTY